MSVSKLRLLNEEMVQYVTLLRFLIKQSCFQYANCLLFSSDWFSYTFISESFRWGLKGAKTKLLGI